MAALANKRHEKFCHEYIKDMNATQAAIRTGYSKNTANRIGSRLLSNVDIKARVAELREAYFNENIMTAQMKSTSLSKVQATDTPKLASSINRRTRSQD